MAKEPLGQRIMQARLQQNWSRERLAAKVGVTWRTVLRWELKGMLPQPESQKRLIDLFGFEEQDFQRPSLSQEEPVPLAEAPGEEEPAKEPSEPAFIGSELEQMLPPKDEFKMYVGRRIYRRGSVSKTTYVTVNGRPLPYFDWPKRNPETERLFEWGYGGEGPRHLAESILADYLGEHYPDTRYLDRSESNALLFGGLFKEEMIAILPSEVKGQVNDDWQITSPQIRRWFYSLEADGITRQTLLENIYGKSNKEGESSLSDLGLGVQGMQAFSKTRAFSYVSARNLLLEKACIPCTTLHTPCQTV